MYKCIFCGATWDNAALISADISLTTADVPRSISFKEQPICADCISLLSKRIAINATEAARTLVEKEDRV